MKVMSEANAMAKNFATNPSTHIEQNQQKDNGKTRTCAPEGIWIDIHKMR